MSSHTDEYWLHRIETLQRELDSWKKVATANVAANGMNEALLLSNQRCSQWELFAYEMLTVLLMANPDVAKPFEKKFRMMKAQVKA